MWHVKNGRQISVGGERFLRRSDKCSKKKTFELRVNFIEKKIWNNDHMNFYYNCNVNLYLVQHMVHITTIETLNS